MLRRVVMSQIFCRKKKSMKFRLKRKLTKDKDRFSMTKTKSEHLHPWFTKPRVQILLKEMERMRNINRHTIKFNKKTMDEFVSKAEEYSDYCTHRFYADQQELKENEESLREVECEAKLLPKYLQEELEKDSSKFEVPFHLRFFAKYQPQMVRVLPKKLAENWHVAMNSFEVMEKDPYEFQGAHDNRD